MESTTVQAAEAKANKKARQRSVAYPSYTIESSSEFTTKIDKEFTSVVYTPGDAISKNLGISGGAFLMQLSSAVQYKLLELKSGEGYKPTDIFQKIKNPLPSENVNDTLIECFKSPPLYKKLLAEFKDKQLPTETGLANILARNYGVHGNAATIASKVFLKNIAKLGLLGAGNILRLDSSYIPFEETDDEQNDNNPSPTAVTQNPQLILPAAKDTRTNTPSEQHNKFKEIPVFLLGNNREAKVVLPIDFTEDDLKRVVKVLNAYLP